MTVGVQGGGGVGAYLITVGVQGGVGAYLIRVGVQGGGGEGGVGTYLITVGVQWGVHNAVFPTSFPPGIQVFVVDLLL